MKAALLLLALTWPAFAGPQAIQPPQTIAAEPYLAAARAEILPLFAGGEHLNLAPAADPAALDRTIARAAALPGRSLIYLAAPSAAGKSTLANGIAKALGSRMKVLSLDSYFKDSSQQPKGVEGTLDFDRPESLKLEQASRDIQTLLAGGRVELPSYDFATGLGSPTSGKFLSLEPGDVLVVDSIYASAAPILAAGADRPSLNVFLKAPAVVRLKRRLKRDREERGASMDFNLSLWGNILHDERHYILPQAGKADVTIDSFSAQELAELPEAFARLLAAEWAKAGAAESSLAEALKRRIKQSLAADAAAR